MQQAHLMAEGSIMLAVELFIQPYCRGLIVDWLRCTSPYGHLDMSSEHMLLESFTCGVGVETINSVAEISLWLAILDIQTK